MSAVDQQLGLALRLWQTDNAHRAKDVLDDLGGQGFERWDYWWLRVKVAHDLHGPSQAVEAAKAGLQRFPNDADLLSALGDELEGDDRHTEAESAYLAALAIDPEHIESLCGYAVVTAGVGQIHKAERLVDRAAQIDPENLDVLITRYQIANFAGDDQLASQIAERFAERTGGSAPSLTILSIEAAKRGQYGESMSWMGRAATADIRSVEAVGADYVREVRLAQHPLLLPMWPLYRFGAVPMYVAAVGSIAGLGLMGFDELQGQVAIAWVAYVVYSWVMPPLIRWLGGGR